MMQIISFFIVLFSFPAMAAWTEVDRQELVNQNLLKDRNPGGESGAVKWTKTGGTLATVSTSADVHSGNRSLSWDASGASQILSSAQASLKQGMGGTNGLAMCWIKTAATDIVMSAYDGSNTLATTTVPSSDYYTPVSVNFIFPTGAITPQIRFTSASDSAVMYFDDCFFGPAYNLSQVSHATFIGSAHIGPTASCSTTTTSTSLVALGTAAACPGPTVDLNPGPGIIQTTDANGFIYTVNNLSPGYYQVMMNVYTTVSTSANGCLAISDGTTTSGQTCFNQTTGTNVTVLADFNITTAGNKTFTLFGSTSTGTLTAFATQDNIRSNFSIYRFPLSSQTAYTPDQAAASWSGYHASDCSWSNTTTGSAWQSPGNDGSCTFTETSNTNFGTVASTGAKTPGITFTPRRAGKYMVCVSGRLIDTVTDISMFVRLNDGSGTMIDENGMASMSTSSRVPFKLCGILNATSVSAQTAILQILRGTASAGTQSLSNSTTGTTNLFWQVFSLDQSFPAPLLVNSVVNSSSGVTGVEAAAIECKTGSTILSQLGSWVSSVGNVSGGKCDITISAGYTATPYCWAIHNNVAGTPGIIGANASSTTSVSIDCVSNAGTDCTDYDVNLFCMGAK